MAPGNHGVQLTTVLGPAHAGLSGCCLPHLKHPVLRLSALTHRCHGPLELSGLQPLLDHLSGHTGEGGHRPGSSTWHQHKDRWQTGYTFARLSTAVSFG